MPLFLEVSLQIPLSHPGLKMLCQLNGMRATRPSALQWLIARASGLTMQEEDVRFHHEIDAFCNYPPRRMRE